MSCKIDIATIKNIISTKKQLKNIPIIFNVDFGHVLPFVTVPIGGVVRIIAESNSPSIDILNY